jgi:orotate phosphoribosyltransferase
MTDQSVQDVLARMGAVLTNDHFVYTSGKHGANYVAKDVLYTNPIQTSRVCWELAVQILAHCVRKLQISCATVVSPVVGGVALSQWVTYHLIGLGEKSRFQALATFADRDQTEFTLSEKELIKIGGQYQEIPKDAKLLLDTGAFVVKRGYGKLITDQNVVVVEDVLTTGRSAKATVEAVKKIEGNVVMVAAVCNRGGVTAEMLGVPYLHSAVNVNFETFDPDNCPLCKMLVPINTEFGHGKAFLEKMRKKPSG